MKLAQDADLTHEDARGWYASYGWHISTENCGDVELDAVEYDWLDGTDDEALANLTVDRDGLTADEAEALIAKAREVREAGEEIESLLAEAVEAYLRGDVGAVVKALNDAALVESDHGDSPASRSLRAQLLETDSAEGSADAQYTARPLGGTEWAVAKDGEPYTQLSVGMIDEDGEYNLSDDEAAEEIADVLGIDVDNVTVVR